MKTHARWTRVGLVLLTLVALALGVLGAGPASASGAKTTICHRHGNGTFQEISVSNSAVRAHLAHGDTVGPCRPPDRTRPTITVTTPASGAVYGVGRRVEADYDCADEEGGSGIALCIGSVEDGSPINTAAGGSRLRLFLVLAVDNAGNVNLVLRTYTLQADSTAPTVTLTNPVDGRSYDQGAEVLAEYTCADEAGGSGLASCAGPVASGAAIDTATLGEHEFTVTAVDHAGNETVVTHAYTVTNGSDPVVTVTSPVLGEDGGASTYVVGETVLADFSCAAQPGGAAIVSCVGNIADGDPLDTSQWRAPAYLVVDATDNAGRSTRSITPYIVLRADDIAPQVWLGTPNDLDVYAQGSEVVADFGCEDTGDSQTFVSGVATCEGTVPAGELIDTATLGEHEFTVTATDNAGNEAVVTHTYTVENATTPVTITTPADGGVYLRGEEIIADYECAGMVTCQGFAPGRRPIEIGDGEPIPVELRRFQYAGTFTFWVVGTDDAGNETTVTHTYTVRSAPNVELSTPADGEVFLLGQEVQAGYSCEGWLDGGPEIVTCDGTIAAGDLVDTSAVGDYSFTVTGVDADGNETTVTHAYSVVEDTTPPTATLFTPADGAIYALGEEVHVDWFCDDTSGFVICDGTASYGDLVDTTTVGEHIFTMTATDGAGNETVVTHTYSVE